VQTAVFARARLLFEVKPSAFHPPPKVDSAVVLLERRPPAVPDSDAFVRFAGECFRHKRKTLRNNLSAVFDKQRVDALPETSLRAEQLSLEQLVSIYQRLTE
jgi:16S rRNA (adenine1518-N6/adenine1519-N6)-dimethyltransferase